MCFVFNDVQLPLIQCDELMGHLFCINPSKWPTGTRVANFLGLKPLKKVPLKVGFLKPEGTLIGRHLLITCEVISDAVTASVYVCVEAGAFEGSEQSHQNRTVFP